MAKFFDCVIEGVKAMTTSAPSSISHPYDLSGYANIFPEIARDSRFRPTWKNSTVMAAVKYAGRIFPEARCYIEAPDKEGISAAVENHALTKLLRRPNPGYSGRLLWQATLASLILDDNAYWLKVRSSSTRPAELWYLPHHLMRVIREGSDYVTAYEYMTQGGPVYYRPKDIVHFRDGIDPESTGRGLRKMEALGEEILTDNEASAYAWWTLRNVGVSPFMVSPKGDFQINETQADELKRRIHDAGRDMNRGKPLVPNVAIEVSKLGSTVEEMALDKVRRWPVDKILSVIGFNAMVLGLPSESKTFANMKEAREAVMEEFVCPTQTLISDTIEGSLLPDFSNNIEERLAWDLTRVRVLQEDQNALSKRTLEEWKLRAIDRAEARGKLGYIVTPEDENVWYEPAAAPVADPNAEDGERPPKSDPMKAWEQAMAKKWQERAAS